MRTYKGTYKDMTCRDKKYELGKTYEENHAALCQCGFHSCIEPIEVFAYYPLRGGNRYFVCDARGELDNGSGLPRDSKIASSKITLIAEMTAEELIKEQAIRGGTFEKSKITLEMDYSSAATVDDYSRIVSQGKGCIVATSGKSSTAVAQNAGSIAITTGCSSVACSFDVDSSSYSTGINSTAFSECGSATTTGPRSISISIDDDAEAMGEKSMAISTSSTGCVRGEIGTLLTLYYYEYVDGDYVPTKGVTERVDGIRIKPGVWYCLNNDGEFVKM